MLKRRPSLTATDFNKPQFTVLNVTGRALIESALNLYYILTRNQYDVYIFMFTTN